MTAIDTQHFRKLLDQIDEEAKDADSRAELDQVKAELAELKTQIATLPDEIRAALEPKVEKTEETVADEAAGEADEKTEETVDEKTPRRRFRAGRKHGQPYQDEAGGFAKIWDGEDEPDRVEITDDDDGVE